MIHESSDGRRHRMSVRRRILSTGDFDPLARVPTGEIHDGGSEWLDHEVFAVLDGDGTMTIDERDATTNS